MRERIEEQFDGYDLKATDMSWGVYKDGKCVAAGGVLASQGENMKAARKAVAELKSGKRKALT